MNRQLSIVYCVFAAVVSLAVLVNSAGSASAAVVVQDTFTGTPVAGNGAIVGRTPDTINTAGNIYTEQQNANVGARLQLDNSTGNPSFSLRTGFNNSAHILYSNGGVPTAPITLSIDAQINNIQDDGAGGAPRGIGLGFYNPLPTLYPGTTPSAHTNFTGIAVNPAGTLEYVSAGASQGIFTTAPGGFSTSAFNTLSYTVDPTTSTLTSLNFAGTDYLTDFTTAFAAPGFTASDRAGFYGQTANNANLFGRVDNFIVSGTLPPTPPLRNPGFESPDFGTSGWKYGVSGGSPMTLAELAGAVWTFGGGAGLSGPNGPWKANDTSLDPLGDQFAFLQGPATVSQDLLSLVTGNTYDLSFFESYRTQQGSSNDLTVILDEGLGTELTIYSSSAVINPLWEARQTDEFLATKDSYTLTFRTTNPLGGDRSTLIDGVELHLISEPPAIIPEPVTMAMTALALTGLGRYIRKRRRA